jgi:NAD(P)-dependent dehydrogenase (short-subunit alcohol dehydrogenase family)
LARNVLITGASGGIGRAIAARFVAGGDTVVITGRNAGRLQRAATELGAHGVVCDAADPAQVAELGDRIGATLDVLDANLISAVLTTHAVADRLAPGGSVISIGTIGAERGGGSYGAAKAALAAWNADLSSEIGPRGVTANVISAGYIAGTNFFRDRLTPQRRETLVAATHDKRPGAPDDIAETAYFLASPGARHITGQTIHVNGGAFTTR